MIPKTIHRIWLGGAPIPEESEEFWKKFQDLHPDWELRTWTDEDRYRWLRNRELFESAGTWTSKSDVLRFELLRQYGGIYVDTDVEPLKNLDRLRQHGAFAGWETEDYICGAVMGAEPEHPAVVALVDTLPYWISGRSEAPPDIWAGPKFLSSVWIGRDDVKLLPQQTFYPYGWEEKPPKKYPTSTLAVHHWSKSWRSVSRPDSRQVKVSILMPWTDRGDRQRQRSKEWTEAWWKSHFPDAEFIIGTDYGREPFNRSACFNDAASRATGDVLILTDADAVVSEDTVRELIEIVAGERLWGNPFQHVYRLTPDATSRILEKDPASYVAPKTPAPVSYEGLEEDLSRKYGGFVVILPRAAWDAVGGMDEKFEGWGSEDIALMHSLDTLWGPHWSAPAAALHLWHRRPKTTLSSDANKKLQRTYEQASGDREAMAELRSTKPTEAPKTVKPPAGWLTSANLAQDINISVLVPFRPDGNPIRTEVWEWLSQRWRAEMPDVEIVIGSCEGEPFSKSAAVNDAYTRAGGEVFVVADADALMAPDRVLRGAAKAKQTNRLIIPYGGNAWRLSEAGTRKLIANDPLCDPSLGDEDRKSGPPKRTAGGIFMISREAFETVEGMDPRFRGWGYEDVSFVSACDALLGSTMNLAGDLRLLWHPYPKKDTRRVWDNDEGEWNMTLRNHYRVASLEDGRMRALVNEHPLGQEPKPIRPSRDVDPEDVIREDIIAIQGKRIRL